MPLVTVQRSPSTNNSPPNFDGSSGVNGDEVDTARNSKSLSECYFAGKGTALVLPAEAQKSTRQMEGSNIQKHLQSMFYLLRPEETLKMAVKLESVHLNRTRYLVVVSRMGRRAEESCLLGIDCNEKTTVGLVLRVLADTAITLDGDGGFSVSVCGRHHIFKPVSVQAMWSALQTLHKASSKAREENYFQGGLSHDWVDYYEERIESDRSCLNEWHAMDNLVSRRPPSPDSIRSKPSEREETDKIIRATLKEIMMSVDLDEVTSKYIRNRLEEELDMDLTEYKSFIDQEILIILGQMDAPTEIFDHVYLGSEWNASNYEELKKNGVRHILNVTREIDNFFPGTFDYLNVRVYDDEKTDLLKYWDNTYKYITKAKKEGSKVLVHCKMGISRSASVVIAYAMKAYNWDFKTAMQHVKEKRTCIKPNTSFVAQLETYQGILDAMKNKEKLQRSKSETNLKSPGDKGERTLPGSQPTPLLQALSRSAVLQTTLSGQDLRQLGTRPKSWSPDTTQCTNILSGSLTPFRSLEGLNKKSSSKESLGSLRRHKSVTKLFQKDSVVRNVLLPCDNGESYSVSPNQIRHLPGQIQILDEKLTATVKRMVNEFESQKDTATSKESNKKKPVLNDLASTTEDESLTAQTKGTPPMLRAVLIKKEIWDPGEKEAIDSCSCGPTNNACDFKCSVNSDSNCETQQTMWTASTTVKTGEAHDSSRLFDDSANRCKDSDPFSNQLDKVFDREERKQQRVSPSFADSVKEEVARDCPSRQSSWGSYDSAVVLGDAPSRHSSLGSGDTRTLPSRNSSWGSYDLHPGGPVYYMNEKGEKIQHPSSPRDEGTVKRTRRKPDDRDVLYDDLSTQCKSSSTETLHSEYPTVVVVDSEKEETETSSAISAEIDIINSRNGNFSPFNNSRLSVSAPERSSSLDLVLQDCSHSRSTSNVSSIDKISRDSTVSNIINAAQPFSVKQHKMFLESLYKNSSNVLKRTSPEEDVPEQDHNLAGIVRSLKKEFEAKTVDRNNHINQNNSDTAQNDSSKHDDLGEDLSLKKLIGKFELGAKENQDTKINLRPKIFSSKNQSRNARFSCIEVSTDKNPIRVSQTPLISSFNTKSDSSANMKGENQTKRPPVVPVVKNPSPNVVVATVIAKATMKQQQFGKSHPLARININPRHNNPVYNTM